MSRLPEIDANTLSSNDRAIYDAIAGPRGGLGGPFAAWFVVPEIAERVNALVDRLRFGSKLDPRIFELISLIVAKHQSADFIWRAHKKHALNAGVSADAIAALEAGSVPSFDAADEQLTYEFVQALLNGPVTDGLYARASKILGSAALVEMVTVAGYYSMNALISRAFDVT